jgi:hypothetical protein
MPTPQEHADDVRYFSAWPATVVDRADPMGLHRVRLAVPGIIDPSAWAVPITMGGGAPQRGGHIVPALGADCIVWFLGGDVERPAYAASNWGVRPKEGSEMPGTAKDAGKDAHDVQVLQLGTVVITVDERPRKGKVGQLVVVENTVSGDHITMDLESHGIEIAATSLLNLKADGILSLEAAQIQINGRIVRPSKDQI